MSTLKVDALSSKTSNTDLTVTADGSGKVDIETGFKVSGTAGVPTADIRTDAITGAKIADDAIDSEHYVDGSIDTAHLAADAVTGAKIADDAIDSEHYAAGSIDTAHIADDQITLAKMASGTDGNIISYDASGNPVAIATGNDGQVLTSTGAGSPPAFEDAGGGAWTLIGSTVASDDATIAVTGISSTYDTHAIFFSDIVPATNDVFAYMRFGDSSGIDSGAGDYAYRLDRWDANNTTYTAERVSSDTKIEILNGVGNDTGEGLHGRVYLLSPPDGTSQPTINGMITAVQHNTRNYGGTIMARRTAVITMDRVELHMASGNITSGRMTVWGIKHA